MINVIIKANKIQSKKTTLQATSNDEEYEKQIRNTTRKTKANGLKILRKYERSAAEDEERERITLEKQKERINRELMVDHFTQSLSKEFLFNIDLKSGDKSVSIIQRIRVKNYKHASLVSLIIQF
ncbi:hypothetical protein ACTFIV_004793 [Dictyostelium citrinum]